MNNPFDGNSFIIMASIFILFRYFMHISSFPFALGGVGLPII